MLYNVHLAKNKQLTSCLKCCMRKNGSPHNLWCTFSHKMYSLLDTQNYSITYVQCPNSQIREDRNITSMLTLEHNCKIFIFWSNGSECLPIINISISLFWIISAFTFVLSARFLAIPLWLWHLSAFST